MGEEGGGSTLFHIEREIKDLLTAQNSERREKNNKQQNCKYKYNLFFNIKTSCYWKKLFFPQQEKESQSNFPMQNKEQISGNPDMKEDKYSIFNSDFILISKVYFIIKSFRFQETL